MDVDSEEEAFRQKINELRNAGGEESLDRLITEKEESDYKKLRSEFVATSIYIVYSNKVTFKNKENNIWYKNRTKDFTVRVIIDFDERNEEGHLLTPTIKLVQS